MAEIGVPDKDTFDLADKVITLTEELELAKTERSNEEEKCASLQLVNSKLEREKTEKDLKISEKDKTIFDLQKKIRELQGELDQLKSIRVVQVQLLSRHESDVMKSARDELAITLTQRISDFELEIVKCMKATEIQPEKPLILLCIGTHAVAQDIRNSIKGVAVSKKMAVVSVHLKAEHALPVHPSDRTLTDKEFESFGGIFDIGFMPDKGLYKCNANDSNITSIVNFIQRVGDKKPKHNKTA